MKAVANNIKWILLVSGALTCTMIYAAIDPHAALASMFGESVDGPLAEIIVRNWGALITLVGLMLIYAAFRPPVRGIAVSVGAVSKLVFIGLVLSTERYLDNQVAIAIGVDAIWVVLFTLYLVAPRHRQTSKA